MHDKKMILEAVDRLLAEAEETKEKLPQAARRQASSALEYCVQAELREREARCRRVLADCLLILAELDGAHSQARQALQAAIETSNEAEEAAASVVLGKMYQERQEMTRALEYLGNALSLYSRNHDKQGQSRVRCALGDVYCYADDFGSALESFETARRLAQESRDPLLEIMSLIGIGQTRRLMEEYDEALSFYHHALGNSRRTHMPYMEAFLLDRIADIHYERQDYQRAVECQVEGLALRRPLSDQIGDPSGMVRSLTRLAAGYISLKRFPEARTALSEAEKLAESLKIPTLLRTCYETLGQFYAAPRNKDADLNKAESYFVWCLDRAQEQQDNAQTARMHGYLADLYERKGDVAKALRHARHARTVERTLYDQQSEQRRRSVHLLRQVELTRKDLEIAQNQAEILYLREVELNRALAEAERLRREAEELIRHDTRTGLLSRRYFEERWAEEFARAQRHQHGLTLALVEVNEERRLRAEYGPDTLLIVAQRIGKMLRERCRKTDLVGHYGDLTFAIAFIETELADVAWICEEIRRRAEQMPWQDVSEGLKVSVSIGIADRQGSPNDVALLREAEFRLLQAKSAKSTMTFSTGNATQAR